MFRKLVAALLLMAISTPAAFADDAAIATGGSWWSEQDAGWYGGFGGGVVGLLGALLGILAGFGLAKRFTIGMAFAIVGFGAFTLVAGITAVTSGQPYHVYYPLLLIGSISTLVFGLNLPAVKRRYEQQELQRMSALDS